MMRTTQICLFIARIPRPSLWQDFYLLCSSPLHLFLHPSLLSYPDKARTNVHQMPPPHHLSSSHPHSLSPFTLCSIQTDGIAITTGFCPCLSLCLPHSALSIMCCSFLSLTKWKISTERERERVEREREKVCSQHMGPSPGFSWATFSVMFCPCRTLGCLHFYEMWFSWLHTASRRPRWNR